MASILSIFCHCSVNELFLMSNKKVQETEEEFDSYIDEEPIAQVSINKYDPYALKGNIDDTIMAILNEKEFVEDNLIINTKIVLGLMMIGLACLSQFYLNNPYTGYDDDWHFPKSYWFHFTIVACYSVLSCGYYYIEYIMHAETFFVANDAPVSKMLTNLK
jgi:hypothetical protein